MLSYEGIFFEGEALDVIYSLEERNLGCFNDEIHCTFKYHPNDKEIFNQIVGKSFDIYIIGYGNDGKNSGFSLLLPDELKQYYINFDENDPSMLKIPHITVSLSEGAKASNTKNLKFKKLKKPVKVTGRFGFWIKEEDKEYLSYKPYYQNKNR